jgi:hydrogenase maturation protease
MKSHADEPRILIIGYGNSLRGDDALGCIVAERLERRVDRSQVRVLTLHQLTPDLAEPVSKVNLAIFIDACADRPAGEVDCRNVVAENQASRSFDHHASPEQILALSKSLYAQVPESCVFSVGGESWGFDMPLSPAVQAAIPRVIDSIENVIAARTSIAVEG